MKKILKNKEGYFRISVVMFALYGFSIGFWFFAIWLERIW